MMTTTKVRAAAMLRALGAWAVLFADTLDPPKPLGAVQPESGGGPGPRPTPKPKRWWWPW